MRLLVHICCGPCAAFPVPHLQAAGHDLTGFFYNPNIHPYREYREREDSARRLVREYGVEMIESPGYELEGYLRQVCNREDIRCRFCYEMRLRKAAEVAREGAYDGFTTTLLVSPRQKHTMIREVGEQVAAEVGVPFYYEDFRPGYREGTERSKAMGLYRQTYCGCIYSERDRYAPRTDKKQRKGNP